MHLFTYSTIYTLNALQQAMLVTLSDDDNANRPFSQDLLCCSDSSEIPSG